MLFRNLHFGLLERDIRKCTFGHSTSVFLSQLFQYSGLDLFVGHSIGYDVTSAMCVSGRTTVHLMLDHKVVIVRYREYD